MTPAQRAAELLRNADALIIGAGAGMGVDSGLPDFRGPEGFWREYPALREAGMDFESIAAPDSFRTHPELAWGFYGHRLALYRATMPHAGFALLKAWGERMARGYFAYTSNVDGQFQKAGFNAERIHECHGSIHHLQCLESCTGSTWGAGGFHPEIDEAHCLLVNDPPTCVACGALARPNILMFTDWNWSSIRAKTQQARRDAWLEETWNPVVIELGAGTAIPSVRHFSGRMIEERNARLIRINPREPEVRDERDVGLAMGALAGLRAIEAALG